MNKMSGEAGEVAIGRREQPDNEVVARSVRPALDDHQRVGVEVRRHHLAHITDWPGP